MNNKSIDLEKICEVSSSKYNSDKQFLDPFNDSNFYKLNISKILTYLNSKLKSENLRETANILIKFLPTDLAEQFCKFKSNY